MAAWPKTVCCLANNVLKKPPWFGVRIQGLGHNPNLFSLQARHMCLAGSFVSPYLLAQALDPSPQVHVCCYVLLVGNFNVSCLICLIITQGRKTLHGLCSEVVNIIELLVYQKVNKIFRFYL